MIDLLPANMLEEAYANQVDFVKNIARTKGISGYKAAVSSKVNQKGMGLKNLLSGVLYAEGALPNGATLTLDYFRMAKVETEIGFKLSQNIESKVSLKEVKHLVKEVLPVIEVPDVKDLNAAENPLCAMVGINLFSSHYIYGQSLAVNELSVNAIHVSLYHNNELVGSGKATDAMDNQWDALTEAINLAMDHGYKLKENDLIITGALGQILEMKKGSYLADYGMLGKVLFDVI